MSYNEHTFDLGPFGVSQFFMFRNSREGLSLRLRTSRCQKDSSKPPFLENIDGAAKSGQSRLPGISGYNSRWTCSAHSRATATIISGQGSCKSVPTYASQWSGCHSTTTRRRAGFRQILEQVSIEHASLHKLSMTFVRVRC